MTTQPLIHTLFAVATLTLAFAATPAARAQSRLPPTPEWGDDTFQASVHPSTTAAVKALADDWGRATGTRRRTDPKLVLVGGSTTLHGAPLEAAATLLRAHFPTAEVRVEPSLREPRQGSASDAETIDVYFKYAETDASRGEATVTLWTRTARIQHKPWLTDFDAFANHAPSRQWVVGRSSGAAISHDEARAGALRSAAASLVPSLRPWLTKWNVNQHLVDDRRLMERLATQLENPDHYAVVNDRFVQQVTRPYGGLWRYAVLVEASPDNLDRLARSVAADVQYERTWARRTFASATALTLVIFLLYLLVNALTKGYFKWPLRTFAVASLTALILAVLLLA